MTKQAPEVRMSSAGLGVPSTRELSTTTFLVKFVMVNLMLLQVSTPSQNAVQGSRGRIYPALGIRPHAGEDRCPEQTRHRCRALVAEAKFDDSSNGKPIVVSSLPTYWPTNVAAHRYEP